MYCNGACIVGAALDHSSLEALIVTLQKLTQGDAGQGGAGQQGSANQGGKVSVYG